MEHFETLFKHIVSGGHEAVTTLMLLITGYLGWDKYKREKEYKESVEQLIEKFQKQFVEDRDVLLKVIEKYQSNQTNMIHAFDELRMLITSLISKI